MNEDYNIFWQMFRYGSQNLASIAIKEEIERQLEIMLPQIVQPLVEKLVKDYISNITIQTDINRNISDQIYKLLK